MIDSTQNMPEAHKRRSARIVQAIPLIVSGVDALGRPFQERTSTLIINCHGCRYQSKHYVLKNMWVTLEVPHTEPGQEPRIRRARVTWIQRPRTVRELFQVGVELEGPGNLWGIAFAPPDWFPLTEIDQQPLEPAPPHDAPVEFAESADWKDVPEPEPLEHGSNVRTIPLSGTAEPSLALARQMTRLVNEAKQQLHDAIRASAAQVVSTETQPLMAALQNQIKDMAERSVKAATEPAAEEAARGALAHNERVAETQLQTARERWQHELTASTGQAGNELSERFSAISQERVAAFEKLLDERLHLTMEKAGQATAAVHDQLAEAQTSVAALSRQASEAAGVSLRDFEQQLRAKAELSHARLSDLDQAAQRLHDQIAAATDSAQSAWQARLDAELSGAAGGWNQQIAASLEKAVQQAAEQLAHHSHEIAQQSENELAVRLASTAAAFTATHTEAEKNLKALRAAFTAETERAGAALAQLQSATRDLEGWSARAGDLANAAQQELERRSAETVEAQSREMARRAEQNITAWTERLQPALESAGQQTMARLSSELEQQLTPRVERASRVLADLEHEIGAAETALHSHQASLLQISEREIETAVSHLQKSIEELEHSFGESSRAAAVRWLAELETKATETTHTTFESLFKTADWYEKKVQNQMQATFDKGLEQATGSLREKAGELSGLFAAELDHYSRSYVEHTHGQIEDVGRDALERLGRHASELSTDSASAFAQQTRHHTDSAMREFRNQSASEIAALSAQMAALTANVRSEWTAHTREASAEFNAVLSQQTRQALSNVAEELASQTATTNDAARRAGEQADERLRHTITALSDDAVGEYKKRLENASNSWFLATATRLNQQSEQQLEAIALSAEKRLRETCDQIFTGLGETLRARMLELFSPPETGKAAGQSK